MFLDKFRTAKQPDIDRLCRQREAGTLPVPFNGRRPDFLKALNHPARGKGIAVIAEFKQASPSRGTICLGLTPEDVAAQYAAGGADCLSVLTESDYFGGDLSFLARMASAGLPMLRKDFIFDALQVTETASSPASAMLLIVRMTPDAGTLRQLREEAEQYGIHSVVEIFNHKDLTLARESGARIIQVNARDLDTLKTDRRTCIELAACKRDGETWIAASGIESARHIEEARLAGYNAVLIGTSLMEDGTPGLKLSSLLTPSTHEF